MKIWRQVSPNPISPFRFNPTSLPPHPRQCWIVQIKPGITLVILNPPVCIQSLECRALIRVKHWTCPVCCLGGTHSQMPTYTCRDWRASACWIVTWAPHISHPSPSPTDISFSFHWIWGLTLNSSLSSYDPDNLPSLFQSPFLKAGVSNSFSPGATSASWLPSKGQM